MILALLAILIVGPFVPNPTLTPGATVPGVNVCGTKWGLDRRHVTPAMRHSVFAAYRVPYEKHALYELDHLIPRELGGADDVANLWPQPWPDAHKKDRLENALHRLVCTGALPLADAQAQIRADWRAAFARYVK
jgi:hypothetical protein